MNVDSIVYLIVFLVTIIAFVLRIIWLEDKLKQMDDRLEAYRAKLQNIERIQAWIEQRTACYIPKPGFGGYGTSGNTTTLSGYSFNGNYLGIDALIKMILKKFGFSVQRVLPSEEFSLVESSDAKVFTGSSERKV